MADIHMNVHFEKMDSRDVRRSTKLANFCGRGLVAGENWPIKWLNHDTRPISSSATFVRYQPASRIGAYTTAECRSQNDTCIIFFCI